MVEQFPKTLLVLDDEVMVPPALNRHLAAVSLRPQSNQYEEGYDLYLSATLGGDDLTLKMGDAEVQIEMDIKFFEVDLTFGKSMATYGGGYSDFDSPTVGVERGVDRRTTSLKTKAEASINVASIVGGRLGVSGEIQRDIGTENEAQTTNYPYHHIEIGCVAAGSLDAPRPLHGNVIQSYHGWRITPKNIEDRSGVLARLRVKRNWVEMRNPRIGSGLGEVAFRLKTMLHGKSHEDQLKTAAFTVLLEKLVHLRLQEFDETEYATLASSAVILKPEVLGPVAVPLKPAKAPLEIDLTVVEDFMNLPAKKAIKFVQEIEDKGYFSTATSSNPDRFLEHRSVKAEDGNGETDLTLRVTPFPSHSPEQLVTILEAVKRSFLLVDHDLSIGHFEDLMAVEYLAGLELLVIEGDLVKGIDMVADDVPSKVLADTIANRTQFGAIFDIYLRHPKETSGTKNLDSLHSGGLVASVLAQGIVSDISDLGEAMDEDHLLRWCKFVHVELGRD